MGFYFENVTKHFVYGYKINDLVVNDTETHDIPQKYAGDHNVSVKSTKSSSVMLGDVCRFFDYDFTTQNIIIIYKYT